MAIAELRVRLAELCAADPERKVFGAASHRYQLRPPLDEPAIAAFEARHDIELPADYRTFVREVGDGGAGPDYGVYGLYFAEYSVLRDPFPYVERTVNVLDTQHEPLPGLLMLCSAGCSHYRGLVVSGAARGTMWNDVSLYGDGVAPYHRTFTGWYEAWIDGCLRELAREPVVAELRRGMPLEEATARLQAGEPQCWVSNGTRYAMYADVAAELTVGEDGRIAAIHRRMVSPRLVRAP